MTEPLFNFGGISSGLDTGAMIDAIMQVERNPVVLMQRKQQTAQQKVDAWSSVSTRFSALRTSVNALRTLDDFDDFSSATGSDDDVMTVTSTGGAVPGSMSFTVDQLATSHQLVSAADFSSEADAVGAGTFTVTAGGIDHDFVTTAGTTVANLADQINGADIGVSANVIQVDDTTAKLVLTSIETGADNQFTAAGTQATLATMDIGEEGVDAQITIGSGAGALVVSRSSNTVDDLIDGVELGLRQTSTEKVRVDVERDLDATVEAVSKFVSELNDTAKTINSLSAYNPETEVAGALQGDSQLRGIQGALIGEVTSIIDSLSGNYSYASSVGIEFSIDGEFSLDEEKLRSALEDDYEAVTKFFARSGTAEDTRMSFSFASDDTVPGDYGVVVTQAATQASTVGSLYVAPGFDVTFQVTTGGDTHDITVNAGDTLESAITKINTQLADAGVVSLRATDTGGAIKLGQLRYGSTGAFTVSGSGAFGLDGTHSAVDVAGTINGVEATGTGQTLMSESGGDDEGLGITINVTETELALAGGSINLGTMTYAKGLMGELSEYLGGLEGADGLLARAGDRWKDQIDLIDDQIDNYERRLEIREETLRQTFTAMESAMATMQSELDYLMSALAGLPGSS